MNNNKEIFQKFANQNMKKVPTIGQSQQQQTKLFFDNLSYIRLAYDSKYLTNVNYCTSEKYLCSGDNYYNIPKETLKVAVDLQTGELHTLTRSKDNTKDLMLDTLHLSTIIQWIYGREDGVEDEKVIGITFLIRC